jgi:outer membrane protein assembly factor BamB
MSYRHSEIPKTFLSFSAVWRPMTLAMLVVFGLASQQAQAYSDDWVMGFHDSRHTGQTSEVVTPPLNLLWTWKDTYTYDNGNGGQFKPTKAFWLPIFYQGKVCFQGGLNANRVFCLNADGTKAWENDNPGYTASGTYLFQFDNYPAVAAGRLIYVSSDLTATVDALTGLDYHNLYNTLGGWPMGGVASWNGRAYEQFIRFDDLSEQFSIIPNPSAFATILGNYQSPDNVTTFTDASFRVPAVDGGVAYANVLGRLEAWDASTRMPLWVWGKQNYGSSPAVANGVVYFYAGRPQNQLLALKASPTGTVSTLWSANIAGAVSPIVSDGVVYVGSSDHSFYALDATTGAIKWTFATGAPFTALQIPAISGDLIYVPGADGNLYILQKSTGVQVGRYSGTAAWGPVVIGGGMVYASDLTNTVYGFQPQTAAIGPSETRVSLSRATNNQAITVNLTGSGFFAGGAASAVQSIVLDNAAGTVLTGYTVASDQAITGIVVPAGIFPGIYHIKVRTTVGSTANEPIFEVAASNSNLISTLGQSPGLYGTGTQCGYQRHLVRTSNGTLIAVYIGPQGSNSRPATYNISRDGGLTWTGQAQLLDAIIWAPSSSVWVDKQDHLNVSYLIGYHQALAKFAVGQSDLLSLDPGFPVVASAQEVLAQTGPMVSESGGRLWVAYKTTAQYDPPGNVIALYSDDGGLTWIRTPQITAAGSSPALILSQDKPAVFYYENGFLVWAVWNGGQWSVAQILPGASAGVQSPSAIVTSNGQIHVAYTTASGGVYYARYSGSNWSAPQTIDAAGNSPSLTTDGTSLWCFYANSTRDLAYRRTNNGQWNPAVAVTSDGNYNTSPATLTLSPDAWIPVIWTSGASTSGYIVKSAVIPGDSGPATLSALLGIAETPTGNFTQGQSGASYTVTVSNSASAGPTSGTVTVTETTPSAFTLVLMAGSGWVCSGNTCARSDVLNASLSYPAITVTVNVPPSAPSPVTNQVSVSGGNSAPASTSGTAVVVPLPILSILETHNGNFSQGQTAAVYNATVSNQTGAGPSSGTVTVTGTTPVGLTLASMAGSGWGCSGNTCTRADALNAGLSYPAITATVNVAASAPAAVTNQVTVTGGNSAPASASDTAVVVTSPILPGPGPAAFVKTDTTTQGSWKSVYGSQGANVIGDSASYPSYVTVTPSHNATYVWTTSTSDVRAPMKLSSTTGRVAGCWFSSGVFTIDLNFTDGQTHQVALYALDFDNYGRSERIDILDANGAVLDTRPVSGFVGGQYLVWNLSGHVTVRVTNTNPVSNGMISGLFFGPPTS